jgi:hypothetical protein
MPFAISGIPMESAMRLTPVLLHSTVFGAVAVAALAAIPTASGQQALVRQKQLIQVQPVDPNNPTAKSPDQAELDAKALESAGLKASDPDGLLKYLKERTLTDIELTKIQAIIKNLASEDFDTRLKASGELEKMGPPAIAPLRLASKDDSNPAEVVYRSKDILRRIEKVSHAEVASAAIRALAKVKNPEIVPTLLGFMPLSDSLAVSEQIQATLSAAAVLDGKPDVVLLEALKSTNSLRRTAAAIAFIEGAPAVDKGRVKDVYPKVLALAKAEPEPAQKFTLAKSLLLFAKEKEAVVLLIDMIPTMGRGQIWQTEDLLGQLAGKDAPKVKCLKTKDSLTKASAAWKEWWTKAGEGLDVAKVELKPRLQGNFVLLTLDYRNGQSPGLLTEYGPDEKERWRLSGLGNPSDFAFGKDDRILIADQNTSTISERDRAGKVLSSKRIEVDNPNGGGKLFCQPMSVQLLENGNRMVFCRQAVVEYDKEGKEVMKYVRPNNVNFGNADICAGLRLKSGETLLSVQNNGPNGQAPQMIYVDAKGKEVKDKVVKTGPPAYQSAIVETGEDRVILGEQNQMLEYNLKTGKVEEKGFKRPLNNPRSIQKMPSGNILFLDFNVYPARVVEITPEGEEAWSYNMKDPNINLMKAMVR